MSGFQGDNERRAMIEPMSAMTNRDQDVTNYKPLAVMAVVAFVAAALFVGLIVILTLVGLVSRKPVLEAWLIGFAIIGVLLSIAARWQIRISEGTRAGEKLAKWALWLSVIGGCIYVAYYAGSVMSIQSQADRFVQDAWLNALKSNDTDSVFLYTLDPTKRIGVNVKDMRARFGDPTEAISGAPLVRLLLKAKGNMTVEPKGTVAWHSNSEGGFHVTSQYLITTPEGKFEVLIPAESSESKELEGRQWQIRLRGMAVRTVGLTAYGKLIAELERESRLFLWDWSQAKLRPYMRVQAYLDTEKLTREERGKRVREFLVNGIITNWIQSATEPARGLALAATFGAAFGLSPNFGDIYFPKMSPRMSTLVRFDESRQKQSAEYKKKLAEELLVSSSFESAELPGSEASIPTIEITDKVVRARFNVKVMLPAVGAVPGYRCRGYIIAICDDPKVVAEANQVYSLASEGKAQIESDAPEIKPQHRFEWRISDVVIDLARDMSESRPGGATPTITAPAPPRDKIE
jgi:hypothetical protein